MYKELDIHLEADMGISKYDRRQWGYVGLSVLVMVPLALFMGYARRTDLFGDNAWLAFAVFLVLGAAVWSINILWWRSLDDVHQQGLMSSWYHAGFLGAFAFMLWMTANNIHKSAYGEGAMHMFFAQVAAGFAMYLWWKWRGSAFGPGAKK